MLDLEPAAQQMTDLIRGVPDGPLDGPTPCPAYTLGDLLDHIGTLTRAFTVAATKTNLAPSGSGRPVPDAANLDDDWRGRIPRDLTTLVEAWRDPEAWTGMTRAGGIDLPGEVAGLVVLDELILHGWDLARATDQPFDYEPALLEAVLDFVAKFAPPDQEAAREGLFGPVVPVPEEAPLLDRLLGLAGRDPAWSPAVP
jgi:uncharacterized protein (TIGR03086 family)